MNDEIKAFLVNIKGKEEWKQIYNYITNLQQENERLKEEKQRLLYNLEKVCEEDATTNN